MTRALNWLKEHRVANICIVIAYYILVVAPHKRFGTFINKTVAGSFGIKISSIEGRAQYNLVVMSLACLLLLFVSIVLIRRLRNHPEKKKIITYTVANVILAAIAINVLFVINIEVIHFPQYAMFAILIYPLIGNYTGTLIWATMGGMLDEAYQYFYLAPKDTSYYDLNDVVTNLIGAVFGLLILAVFRINEYQPFKLKTSSIWGGLILVFVSVLITHASGVLSIYPSDDRPYHILREWPPGFWSHVNPDVTFHVMRPIEGVVVTIVLWVFFSQIGPSKLYDESSA